MNKKKLKIIISIVILLAVAGALYVLYQQKKGKIGESAETPIGQNIEEVKDAPINSTQKPTVKSETQVLFDNKMKEASAYFLKKDYSLAVVAYNQALNIKKSDYVYAGLYSSYLALKDYSNAEKTILSAIELNSKGSDYWSWYLVLLQDAMKAPRSKLDAVYNDALNKVLDNKKINIITQYARILENIGDYTGAIAQWQKAMTLNPDMKSVYQGEIDLLQNKL